MKFLLIIVVLLPASFCAPRTRAGMDLEAANFRNLKSILDPGRADSPLFSIFQIFKRLLDQMKLNDDGKLQREMEQLGERIIRLGSDLDTPSLQSVKDAWIVSTWGTLAVASLPKPQMDSLSKQIQDLQKLMKSLEDTWQWLRTMTISVGQVTGFLRKGLDLLDRWAPQPANSWEKA